MRLRDKVAIITGGGSGIGRATATLFASEGARIVVADYNANTGKEVMQDISGAGGQALFVETDVSDSSQVEQMTRIAVEAYGGIDILLNAAGVFEFGTVLDTDEKTWNSVISVHLTGTFLCSKAVLPHMIKRGGGSIINVSSTAGAHDAIANAAAYVAAKGGVGLLSKAMALDHGKNHVRVNVLVPGPTDTPMLRKHWTGKEIELSALSLAMGRPGRPEDLAYAALFLASNEASFVTGAMLAVDGGQTAGGLSKKLS